MKTGLVLEGGAMRGMYTAGVLDVLMENEIWVDGYIGVSAGVAYGCNYKSRQIGRVIRYNKKYCNDPRFASFRSLITTGDLFNVEFSYHEIPEKLDLFDVDAYNENPVEFYAVCTDVETGEAVYRKLGNDDDIKWMQASASMPLVSRTVKINGREYLDGGIADSVPLRWFQENGYEKNLVVLTQPEGFRKEKSSALGLMRLLLKKYPKIVETMEKRHVVYNETLDEIEKQRQEGSILVIKPSKDLQVKRVERDPEKLEALYQLGRADTESRIDEIKEFFAMK